MGFTLDLSGLNSAVNDVLKKKGRACADSLNKAALHTIIGSGKGGKGAMQLQIKASKSAIKNIPQEKIRAAVVARLRAEGTLKDHTALTIASLTIKERSRRISAIGYNAYLGWTPAAVALGGTGAIGRAKGPRGPKPSNNKTGMAWKGYANKALATAVFMECTMVNTAPMAEIHGTRVIQPALDNAVKDLEYYVMDSVQKAAYDAGFTK